jgi:hypothetical protein
MLLAKLTFFRAKLTMDFHRSPTEIAILLYPDCIRDRAWAYGHVCGREQQEVAAGYHV